MKIWLAYVNYPITTAVYLKRALLKAGHDVTTIGPRLPEEAVAMWGLENMKLPLDGLDLDTSFTPDMAAIWDATPVSDHPDLYLWVESVNGHEPQNLQHLTCPKACYLIDTHYHLPQAIKTAKPFDYVFIAQLIDLQAFREIYPHTYWLPLACDSEIHGRQDVEQTYEIGFVGSFNNRRTEMLDLLAEHFTVHRERAFWTEMARTFSASKIVLNDASFDDLNMRFFEALASGSMLLSNMTKGSGQDILFIEGTEYACHHDEDLLEVANRYLVDGKLREHIAAEGRKRVLAAHTYLYRINDLLDVVTGKKQDTFSPDELRSRSLLQTTGDTSHDHGTLPRIRSIITTRYRSNWPTWQMVHEWEDILATLLAVPLRPIGESCMLPRPDSLPGNFDLIFLQLAGELSYYAHNPQLIPIVMDLWRDDFTDFVHIAPQFSLVFVTNLQAFQELSPRLPNLRYLPFSLADQYVERQLPEKDIDIIQYGRRNPKLDQYMTRLMEECPAIQYVTTEADANEGKVRIYSNQKGYLGESDSRKTFMDLLCRCKISLVSTVGMDSSRDTGGIDPVSPRFLESMAAGCHLVGRIPDNPEFGETGLNQLCHHVDNYENFKTTVFQLLTDCAPSRSGYRQLLQGRQTSLLAVTIMEELLSFHLGTPTRVTPETVIQNSIPRYDIQQRLTAIEEQGDELSQGQRFSIHQILSDAISYYGIYWGMDLSDLFTNIIRQQRNPASALIFTALALASTGNTDSASQVAYHAMQLDPSLPSAAYCYADLQRRNRNYNLARLIVLETLKKWPSFKEVQATFDMCDVDETLSQSKEYYDLLHTAHLGLRPRRYIEIGISSGKALALAKTGTFAIGIDPVTALPPQQVFHSVESTPVLFQMTSDDFFQLGHFERTWGGLSFDMAFIDGLHLFEQALKDFIHLEQRSAPDSIIFIHDCLPVSIAGASRERNTMVWTGDVWKVILCLKQVRPDLEIVTFPVRPSGLAMVRRLDRSSRVLANQFDTLVSLFMDAQLPESMAERFQLLNVTNTPHEDAIAEVLRQQGTWQGRQTAA